MKIGVLTSTRADFGIYRPLLELLRDDPFFELVIIAFGTHLSNQHGYTLNAIKNEGYKVNYTVQSLVDGDNAEAISTAMALTGMKFLSIWEAEKDQLDLVLCLGDRYEMFAAVQAAIPYNIRFAHIHGGEKTLGAIDNTFRHCLSLMSDYHFTSHPEYAERVASLKGNAENVYTVGALALNNLSTIELYSVQKFKEEFGVDLSKPTILFTFHPETKTPERNKRYIQEVISVLQSADKYQVLITGTNADTHNSVIRTALISFSQQNKDCVFMVETLGTSAYFSAMKHCSFLLGNSSSGIIEAASLGTYVINIGDRQKGRISGKNVFNVPIDKEKIKSAIVEIEDNPSSPDKNIYCQGDAAQKIIKVLKKDFDE